jgi:hypothetical protein
VTVSTHSEGPQCGGAPPKSVFQPCRHPDREISEKHQFLRLSMMLHVRT